MIIFGVLVPAICVLEMFLLGTDIAYLAIGLAVSVAMVYLTTNVSTDTLLETRAKVEATEADLRIATRIQADVLPDIFPAFPERPEFEVYASMDPAKEVGNTAICSNNREEMFVTVWLGILELSTGKLTAANAGHEYPAMRKGNGQFELFKDKHGFVPLTHSSVL